MLASKVIESPVGRLTLVASDAALVAILWPNDDPRRVRLSACADGLNHPLLIETDRQLAAYFAGELTRFTVPLDFRGTDFQQQVWAELVAIPYGETRSYGQIAQAIGRPTASRAVGAANGRNPISIIAPCHRVVGSNGALTGFAGGLAVKEQLLALERGTPQGGSTFSPGGAEKGDFRASERSVLLGT
ncbi:methylated-DNA--[protein]-cysteine S-methyltransferase [Sphingomonas sp. SUN019]|uniref:methylated-DNA--[protein]-cysteine S-methyltransferase n=1 Tax=Sphingomonas sp. SUN019 TaxID=2937788 RepID=UPI0021645829|nr:methylated-DNA--[protein]-cysteine S-methyltransferase [Sphingomonas sp. SUN019]UVO51812.1 methylated-DNA--[protein]-cysteine S-methyltransferase [Sphingomonas sp. SUN019]